MIARQPTYSTTRDITVLICTFNVDAQKPETLDHSELGMRFLPDCLGMVDSPEIIEFGFQEMIDLENKTLTAS